MSYSHTNPSFDVTENSSGLADPNAVGEENGQLLEEQQPSLEASLTYTASLAANQAHDMLTLDLAPVLVETITQIKMLTEHLIAMTQAVEAKVGEFGDFKMIKRVKGDDQEN